MRSIDKFFPGVRALSNVDFTLHAGEIHSLMGENGAGNYTESSISAMMVQDSVLDETNRRMRVPQGATGITLSIKSRYRNYIGTKLGSTGQLSKTFAPDPTLYYNVLIVTQGIGTDDAGRFNLYGQRFYEDIADLSKLYVSSITSWAGCTQMKTLKFGDNTTGFYNPALTDIKGSGNPTFGACEVLDLRNCTVYADGDFRNFPAVETLLLEGCDALESLQLPSTDNLETLQLPKNIDTLELKEVDLIIHTIIAECCDWLAMNTNLSHDKIEGCRNLMLTVKEEQFKAQEPTEDEHWQEVRERAAIAAMQGLLANPSRTGCFRDCAETAIEYADALIKQLKSNQ